MATIIILIILAICAFFAIQSYRKKVTSGCCGAGGDGPEKRVRVSDKNPSHYPFQVELTVDGMSCGNCVRRIENKLNELDGVWATVSLEKKKALVRMKTELPETQLLQAVEEAGYSAEPLSKK